MAVRFGLKATLRASTALMAAHPLLRAAPMLVPASLLALGTGGAPALAQTVWSGPGTDFNTGTNWSTGNVPTTAQAAVFQGAGPTSLSTSLNTQLSGIIFDPAASGYNLTLGDDMTLTDSVVNNSANQQTINVASGKTLFFQGTAASGTDVNYGGAGVLVFDDNATGGNSAFTVGSQIGIRGDARTIVLGSLSGASGTLVRNFTANDITVQIGSLGTSTTFGGQFGSAGGAVALTLDKVGTGTLTLTGANELAGTTITAGTLAIANGGTLGDGAVTNNAALVFNRTDTSTFANTISGSGNVTQAGSGTTILTGDNTYTGTTTISAGTLRIGNGGTTGTLGAGAVLNNASLVFNRDSLTVTNAIAGTGSVTIAGSTALSGTNSYQGGTVINSFLSVAANSALGATSGGLTFNNGFLGTTASFTSNRAITINSGGAFFEPSIGTTLTLTGLISGAGDLSVNGPGTLVLSSGNTYLGATMLNGGTTVIAADSAFGNTAGRLYLNGGTLQTTENLTTARDIELQSSGASFTPDAGTVLTLSGAVIGSNLTKTGTGTLVLTGANTYSGTTTISAGTLRVGNGGLTGSLGSSAVVNNAALVFDRDGALMVSGAISGSGTVTQTGAGTTILTSANTYSGTTTIDANGTLQIGAGGTTGTLGSGNVVIGNNLQFNRSDAALTVANAISGVGQVRQIGSGTTTLTGALSHTGGTFVDTGTLILGNALNAVTLPSNATITSGGSLTLANGTLDSATIMNSGHLDIQGTATAGNASIINAGSVRFLDSATGGAAAYTGQAGSIMDFASMAVSGATLGSLAGTGAVSLGSLALTVGGNNTSTTFAGVIAGSSSSGLTKVGTGTLTLTGTNTYSGPTTLSAGTLKLGSGGTTGTLGSGAIINNSVLVFDRSDAFTMANTITGMGALTKNGAGNLSLTGDSSAFAGSTQVAAGTLSVNGKLGGNLGVASGAILGGLGTIGGNVTVDGTLSAGNSPGTLTVNGDLTLKTGSTALFELNSSGVVGGAGVGGNDLVKVGGALTLDGTLDARVAAAGYYRLFEYGTLAPGSAFATETISSTNGGFTVGSHTVRTDVPGQVNLSVLGAGQTMQFWDGNNSASNGSVDGGSGIWQSFATNWTDDGSANGGWGGSVGVFAGMAGTVAVTGTQSFDTLQFLSDGYKLQGDALAFGVAGGGTFNIGSSVTATIASTLQDGVGSALTKVGSGTLVLSGTNSYSGGTTLLGGVVSVEREANLGNASGALSFNGGVLQVTGTGMTSTSRAINWGSNGGGFDIANAGNSFTLAQTITGVGSLTKRGAGTLVLNGANAYGNTMVEAGTLIGHAGSISGNIGVAGGAFGIFDETANASFAGDIGGLNGGKGAMRKQGTGTLTLAGTSTLDWAVVNGGLVSAAERFSGNASIASGASLTFTQGGNGIYAGTLSGAGRFAKSGTGTATLTGDSSAFSGVTTIADGTLIVGQGGTGKLGGTLEVLAGGTLGGSGTVGTTTLAAGATLAPGNSIGTLTVAGDLVFAAGARFAVEVAPDGASSDLVAVTGTATINGGNVAHIGMTGTYDPARTYTILAADGGVGGTFDTVTSDFAFLDASLSYGAKAVMLTLARNDTDFAAVATTLNQRATAAGLDGLSFGNAVYDAVVQLDDATSRTAFDQLSGEIHASATTGLIEDSDYLRRAVNDRIRAAFEGVGAAASPVLAYDPAFQDGIAVWSTAFGARGSIDNDGNASSIDRRMGGFIVGADAWVVDQIRLGLLAGYSHSSLNAPDQASSATIGSYHLGVYGGTQWDLPQGSLALRGGLAYSWHDLDTSRTVSFTGFGDSLSASYDASTIQAFGELGYGIETGLARFEPFVNLAHVAVRTGSFAEDGGTAALTGASGSNAVTFTTVGVRVETDFDLGNVAGRLDAMAGWRHAFGDTTPQSTHSFAGTEAFSIAGSPIGRDALVLDAGLNFDLTPDATVGLSYQGQFASGAQDHGFNANLAIKF